MPGTPPPSRNNDGRWWAPRVLTDAKLYRRSAARPVKVLLGTLETITPADIIRVHRAQHGRCGISGQWMYIPPGTDAAVCTSARCGLKTAADRLESPEELSATVPALVLADITRPAGPHQFMLVRHSLRDFYYAMGGMSGLRALTRRLAEPLPGGNP